MHLCTYVDARSIARAHMQTGFYKYRRSSNYNSTGHPLVLLATEVAKRHSDTRITVFRIRRPNQASGWLIKEYELDEKWELLEDEKVGVEVQSVNEHRK